MEDREVENATNITDLRSSDIILFSLRQVLGGYP